MRGVERAREFYLAAGDLFDRGMYRAAFLLAYYGLFSLGKHEEFKEVWEAFRKGVEIDVSEIERALNVLESALGGEGNVVVEFGLLDLFALGVVGVSACLLVFQLGPPWLDSILIPFIALAGLFLMLRIGKRRKS